MDECPLLYSGLALFAPGLKNGYLGIVGLGYIVLATHKGLFCLVLLNDEAQIALSPVQRDFNVWF